MRERAWSLNSSASVCSLAPVLMMRTYHRFDASSGRQIASSLVPFRLHSADCLDVYRYRYKANHLSPTSVNSQLECATVVNI